ncbi:MAG: hypothetical protein M1832_005132 [Thelocarpon impressellum]|nr:MAG: hypothetical protein M1832_005132 [Thelocarpon impressellum]
MASSSMADTPPAISALIDTLADLPRSPPALYLDLEGVNLCRHGTVSLLEILVAPANHVYLVDVHALGERCFTTPGPDETTTLKSVLEAADVPKVFFDARNDSDALFAHFGVALKGVVDVQLLELAARKSNKRCVNGLAKCIERDGTMAQGDKEAFKAIKDCGKELFDPQRGGSYEVFNARPLPETVRAYCVQEKVREATLARVAASHAAGCGSIDIGADFEQQNGDPEKPFHGGSLKRIDAPLGRCGSVDICTLIE